VKEGRSVVILLIAFALFNGYSYAFEDGDFQFWNSNSISWKVNENWKVNLEEEFRYGDDASDFYYQHSDIGVAYSGMAKWLEVGINYRQIFEEDDGEWEYENRPHANVTLKLDYIGFNMSARSRFEYRDAENDDTKWRYRNKFGIKLPKFSSLEIRPYIADEFFVDLEQDDLNRNRLYTGVSFKLWKHLRGDIYYLWQASESGTDWRSYHILGSKIKVPF